MLVGLAARGSRRDVRFLARHELFGNPVAGPFLRSMRHVPVDRAAPAAAYLRARTLLRQGEAVGIFPEAGVSTSFTVRSLMPGAVALARELGVPIVPMAIWGPQRILTAHRPVDLRRGRPVSLLVGPPLYVDPGDRPAPGDRAARGDGAGPARRPAGPAGAPATAGEPRRGTPPTSGAARRPGAARAESRCRAARCRRLGAADLPRAGQLSRVGSRGASASRARVSARWCPGSSDARRVGGQRRDRVDEHVERRLTGVAASSRLTPRRPPVTARNAVTGSRSDEAAHAGVLGALHEEAVEEVDDQAGRPERGEPALRARDQRERAEAPGRRPPPAAPSRRTRAEPERHTQVGVAGAPVEPLLAEAAGDDGGDHERQRHQERRGDRATRGRASQSSCSRRRSRGRRRRTAAARRCAGGRARHGVQPADQADRDRHRRRPARSRVSSGVASRHRNSTVRYHIGQCGLM